MLPLFKKYFKIGSVGKRKAEVEKQNKNNELIYFPYGFLQLLVNLRENIDIHTYGTDIFKKHY
jgi:hypothetical protein